MGKRTNSPDDAASGYQPECCACHCPVGEGPKVQPFCVDGESWCPRCFTGKRVFLDTRFYAQAFTAVLCKAEACGWEGIAMGTNWCPCCRSRSTVVLPGNYAVAS